MIENLLKQREALDAQIQDVKTSETKKATANLQDEQRRLQEKLTYAKLARNTNSEDTRKKIAEANAELERLKNIYFSDSYVISQIERDLHLIQAKLAEKRESLTSLLSDN